MFIPIPISRFFTASLLVIVLIACQEPQSKTLDGIKIERQEDR